MFYLLPVIDDVFLSRSIIHEYGVKSIEVTHGVWVIFHPPYSHYDFFSAQLRLWYEIHRLNYLFPEHKYLQNSLFKRKMCYPCLSKMPIRDRIHYIFFRVYENFIQFSIKKIIIPILSLKGHSTQKYWNVLKTTKK